MFRIDHSKGFIATVNRAVFAAVVFFICCHTVFAAPATDESRKISQSILSLVNQSVNLINSGEYEKLTALFHYPATHAPKARAHDQCMVAASIKFLSQQFGLPKNIKAQDFAGQINEYAIHVQAGGLKYWQDKQVEAQSYFFTDYAQVGPGILKFQFADLATTPRLRSIAYGFEASEEAKRKLFKLGSAFSAHVKTAGQQCGQAN